MTPTETSDCNRDAGASFAAPTGSPIRVQLSRKKGWRLPPNTVVVSRPSKWGNPFRFHGTTNEGREKARAEAVELYKRNIGLLTNAIVQELRGKNLACWCPLDKKCHADVLLRLANVAGEPQPTCDPRKPETL